MLHRILARTCKMVYTRIMDELIEKLKELGLNEYQSKVYIAMLKKYPATGYEISKIASVPQSRTYDTLKSLEAMHIAIPSNTKPEMYTPIKPKELTGRFKRKLDSAINYLEKKLPDVKEKTYTEPVLTISGRTKILDKIIEIIKGAKNNIFISLWHEDFKYLEQHLLDAYNRGLDLKIVKYDNFVCNFGAVFQHSGIPFTEHYRHNKFIFLTVDDNEGIFGTTDVVKGEIPDMVWTKNKEVVFLIKAFSMHNMYIIDIENNFPEQLRYFYGSGFKKLRDKILH